MRFHKIFVTGILAALIAVIGLTAMSARAGFRDPRNGKCETGDQNGLTMPYLGF